MNIFSKDGFIWWIGVVEDRMDPEKVGRVRVRIFGYHPADKSSVPTDHLPWAIPILPTTSSSLSGVGITPLGSLEGSWVLGFFLDGADMQQPAIFGTIPTKVPVKSFEEANSEISSTGGGGGGISANSRDSTGGASTNSSLIQNNNDGILKDSQGQSVKDGSGNPVRIGVPSVEGWQLGKTSEKYETAGKGPGTINNYKNRDRKSVV